VRIGDVVRGGGAIISVRVLSPVERQIGYVPRVLVVERDEETRDGLEQLLGTDGYRVEPARNEEDAVKRASRCCPDLILVTVAGSPDEAIGSAVRIRRRAEIDTAVPVVVFCVPTIEQGAEVALGRNVYVTRPDNFDQLRDFILRLIVASIGSA
jgi:DNA-binding response OmpR family regulator